MATLQSRLSDLITTVGTDVKGLTGKMDVAIRDEILTNAYRKKVIHNLVYKHADWSYANTNWGSIYPQTFCIDETAREILVISSNPHVVSVYDFDTGVYKNKCFRLTASADTSQSALIRYINGIRYLYIRTGPSQLSRFDITTVTNRVVLTAQQSWTIPMTSDYDYRNGVWTIGSGKSNFGGTTFVNRARFIRRDDTMKSIGAVEFPAMQYGGHVGGGIYSASAYPKVQGFAEGPGYFIAAFGGGFHVGTDPVDGPFWQHGLRLFSGSGELLLESLYPAEKLRQELNKIPGVTVGSVVECEGVEYAFGKIYTITALGSSGDAISNTGGIIFTEEFVEHGYNLDMSPHSSVWTSPSVETMSSRMAIMDDNNDFRNPADWSVMTTVQQICTMMMNLGQAEFKFYTGTKNITDINGNALPSSTLVEILNCNNSSFIARFHTPQCVEVTRYVFSSGTWSQTDGDTGWVTIPIRSGFASMTGGQTFSVRRLNGVVYLRGGVLATGISDQGPPAVAGSYVVADVPVGFRPPAGSVGGAVGTNGVRESTSPLRMSGGTAFISTGGGVEIRTNGGPSSYYLFDTFSYPVD